MLQYWTILKGGWISIVTFFTILSTFKIINNKHNQQDTKNTDLSWNPNSQKQQTLSITSKLHFQFQKYLISYTSVNTKYPFHVKKVSYNPSSKGVQNKSSIQHQKDIPRSQKKHIMSPKGLSKEAPRG